MIFVLVSILKAWQGRDDADFDAVVAEHGPALHRLAASFAPPGAAREDLEQEIVLAIWKAMPRHRGDSSIRTYVFRIAHNCCIDLLRKGQLDTVEMGVEELAATDPSPERTTSARRDLERVAAALRHLPVAQRQSLILALEGLTHREIAELLDVSESAVSVRIHRARAALEKVMEDV